MDERQYERVASDAEVGGRLDGVSHRLSLYDLSTHGCMVEAPRELLPKGRRLVLDLPPNSPHIDRLARDGGLP